MRDDEKADGFVFDLLGDWIFASPEQLDVEVESTCSPLIDVMHILYSRFDSDEMRRVFPLFFVQSKFSCYLTNTIWLDFKD